MTEIDPLLARRSTLPPPSVAAVRPTPAPTATVRRPRRRHPAKGSRIAAAGLGVSTMFGLVATMGIAAASANSAAAPADVTPAAPTIQPTAGTSAPPATPAPPSTTPAPTGAPVAPPVALTVRPEVRVIAPVQQQVQAAPTPAATTSGSH
jgi:hypothetical protein